MQNLAPSNETENVYCLYKAQHRIFLEFFSTQPYNYLTKIASPAIANDMKELNTYLFTSNDC